MLTVVVRPSPVSVGRIRIRDMQSSVPTSDEYCRGGFIVACTLPCWSLGSQFALIKEAGNLSQR